MRVLWCGEERRRMDSLRAAAREEFGGEAEVTLEEVDADEVAWLEGEEEREWREREELLGMQLREEQMGSGYGYQHEEGVAGQRQERPVSMYGSDDEEYDDIFQDVIEEEMRLSQQTQGTQQQHGSGGHDHGQDQDQDMMDLS